MQEKQKWNKGFCSWDCYLNYRHKNGWAKLTCNKCGKEFDRPLNQVKRNKYNYCSFECYLERNENNNKVKCDICGSNIERMPSRQKEFNRHFCSKECRGKWNTKNLSGENSPTWKGGKSFEPYGIEFNDVLKELVRKRDRHTCQECHFTEAQLKCVLDIHHINYLKKDNRLENLISLCKSCHMQTNFKREDWTAYFRSKLTGIEWQSPQLLLFSLDKEN